MLDQPLAVWYSQKSLDRSNIVNAAILSLFRLEEQPGCLWSGSVVVMKFASWNYHDFAPVTRSDMAYLKLYFSAYVGLEETW